MLHTYTHNTHVTHTIHTLHTQYTRYTYSDDMYNSVDCVHRFIKFQRKTISYTLQEKALGTIHTLHVTQCTRLTLHGIVHTLHGTHEMYNSTTRYT